MLYPLPACQSLETATGTFPTEASLLFVVSTPKDFQFGLLAIQPPMHNDGGSLQVIN